MPGSFNEKEKSVANSRRGFTLLELTIVLALVALLSALVVSFTILTSNQLGKSTSYSNFLSEAATLKSYARNSFAEIDEKSPLTVLIKDNDLYIGSKKIIEFEDYKEIKAISFDIDDTAKILKVTLSAEVADASTSFAITSRLGASFIRGEGTE